MLFICFTLVFFSFVCVQFYLESGLYRGYLFVFVFNVSPMFFFKICVCLFMLLFVDLVVRCGFIAVLFKTFVDLFYCFVL